MSSKRIFLLRDKASTDPEALFLDTQRTAEIQTKKQIECEMDIATEIYLARHLGVVHYADLMDSVPEDMASKSMLLAWLNDSTKNGVVQRAGLISLYQKEHLAHFSEGNWSARYFCEFADYVKTKLMDKEFTGSKKAALFRTSFRDPVWFSQALSVCGVKLLEACYYQGTLRSGFARSILSIVLAWRHSIERIGAVVGRSTKNHEASPELYAEIKSIVSLSSKHAIAETINTQQPHWEEEIFQKWHMEITRSVEVIASSRHRLLG